ncbi:protein YIPF1-like [Saccostrea echinata]|uniref:protein YIPF1-like n=1 Tax=Saccostrea echinata TaxID=191078 RepID=UPI002A823EF1|nr:protein YIPF1-like [Saccostrea echinata]
MADVNIDVEKLEEHKKIADELQFQDIPHDPYMNDKGKVQTHTFSDFPPTAESDEDDVYDKTQLIKDEAKQEGKSFWTFEYYQQFFEVETKQVLFRIAGSMFPRPGSNYLQSTIRPNPDLYGPFWICTTLVFTTAIAGNLANYLTTEGKGFKWKYDFHKVTFAATAIFSYWWIIPAALFGFLWWKGSKANYTFLEILCIYGYSLAIYIPISILWVVPFEWLQWTLVLIGAGLSGGVLVLTLWPAVHEETKKTAWIVIILVLLCHTSLAVGFKLYFFNAPMPQVSTQSSPAPLSTTKVVTSPNLPNKVTTSLKVSVSKTTRISRKKKPTKLNSPSPSKREASSSTKDNIENKNRKLLVRETASKG